MKERNKSLPPRGSRGASMLIALLFLLVCLTVGAVVLTAASTNAGRLARNRQDQQDYLAVAAAMELLEDDFCAMSFTGSYDEVTTETVVVSTWTNPETGEEESSSSLVYGGPFYSKNPAEISSGTLMSGISAPSEDLAKLYYSTKPELSETAPDNMSYAIKVNVADDDTIPTVGGTLSVAMDGTACYTITVSLYAERSGVNSNQVTMRLTPNIRETSTTEREVSGDTTTTTTTYTTTITWDDPLIVKGAAG